jgi:hypothetical protein
MERKNNGGEISTDYRRSFAVPYFRSWSPIFPGMTCVGVKVSDELRGKGSKAPQVSRKMKRGDRVAVTLITRALRLFEFKRLVRRQP